MLLEDRAHVEGWFQELTEGQRLQTNSYGRGVVLNRPDGTWCALYERKQDYYTQAGMPRADIVVRTTELDALKAHLGPSSSSGKDKPSSMDKPLGQRERLTLLKIIRALAREANIDISKPSKAAESISATTDTFKSGRVAPRTIAGHLKKIQEEL